MDQIGQAHLTSHRPICKGPPWPFEIILEKRCLKGMFFSSINCQASPTLVFPCTYPSVNTTPPLSVSEHHNIICLSSRNHRQSITHHLHRQSISHHLRRQSIAREKQKTFSVFFLCFVLVCFASFVNIRVLVIRSSGCVFLFPLI